MMYTSGVFCDYVLFGIKTLHTDQIYLTVSQYIYENVKFYMLFYEQKQVAYYRHYGHTKVVLKGC